MEEHEIPDYKETANFQEEMANLKLQGEKKRSDVTTRPRQLRRHDRIVTYFTSELCVYYSSVKYISLNHKHAIALLRNIVVHRFRDLSAPPA